MASPTSILLSLGIALSIQIWCAASNSSGDDHYECPVTANKDCSVDEGHNKCEKDEECPGLYPTVQGCCELPSRCEGLKVCRKLIKKTKESTTSEPPVGPTPEPTVSTTLEPPVLDSKCVKSTGKDILFIVDTSARQVETRQFEEVKQYVQRLIFNLYDIKFKIGLMQFGGRNDPILLSKEFLKGREQLVLKDLVESMEQVTSPERRAGEALAAASNEFYKMNALDNSYDRDDVIVLIARRVPTDMEVVKHELDILKRKRVRVITVGVSQNPDGLRKYLDDPASPSKDVFSFKYKELKSNQLEVLNRICQSTVINPGKKPCEDQKYDVFIAVDGSASINYINFGKKQKLVLDLLVLLNDKNNNIGLMQYSEKRLTKIYQNLVKKPLNDELTLVEKIKYQSGKRTMLGDALRRINQEVFNRVGGDRASVKNVLILFSDGNAHDAKRAVQEAEILKRKGVLVMVVSDNTERELIKKIASGPGSLRIKLGEAYYNPYEVLLRICPSGP